jgi:hypothetical protein
MHEVLRACMIIPKKDQNTHLHQNVRALARLAAETVHPPRSTCRWGWNGAVHMTPHCAEPCPFHNRLPPHKRAAATSICARPGGAVSGPRRRVHSLSASMVACTDSRACLSCGGRQRGNRSGGVANDARARARESPHQAACELQQAPSDIMDYKDTDAGLVAQESQRKQRARSIQHPPRSRPSSRSRCCPLQLPASTAQQGAPCERPRPCSSAAAGPSRDQHTARCVKAAHLRVLGFLATAGIGLADRPDCEWARSHGSAPHSNLYAEECLCCRVLCSPCRPSWRPGGGSTSRLLALAGAWLRWLGSKLLQKYARYR